MNLKIFHKHKYLIEQINKNITNHLLTEGEVLTGKSVSNRDFVIIRICSDISLLKSGASLHRCTRTKLRLRVKFWFQVPDEEHLVDQAIKFCAKKLIYKTNITTVLKKYRTKFDCFVWEMLLYIFISPFSFSVQFHLRRCIKHLRPCLTLYLKHLEICQKLTRPLRPLLSVWKLVKHGLSCITCHIFNSLIGLPILFSVHGRIKALKSMSNTG